MTFAVVKTTFIPVSKVVGIYGMNAKKFRLGKVQLGNIMRVMVRLTIGLVLAIVWIAFGDRLWEVATRKTLMHGEDS